ncbi:MAG TPA: condensation protein [Cyanobacteria bacterium UBA8803]|nr:condensation protein [Cyanobacteria bacterium UBA9273]HBL58882.1 condensation protein [Cyanobacteria bacterium UBA8803]
MRDSLADNCNITMEKPSQVEKIPSDFWLAFKTNVRLQNQAPPIKPVSRNQNLPLSFNQERLWSLEQLQPNTSVHNLLHCLHLKGVLDVAALEQSLMEIAYRHESLRTTFSIIDGQPIQIISPKIELNLPVVDLTELPPEQRQTEAQKLALEDAEQPFDLATAPLWRFKLLRLGEEEHILLRTIHHIIFDGWSHSVFMRELGILYKAFSAGQPSPLSELPIQYADYAQTQRQWLQGEVFSSQLDYWKQQLSGNISPLKLPIDYPRPAVPSYRGAYQPLELSQSLTTALKKLSYQEGVSLFVTLLTAFKTLLYLYTEQEDMIVCSPILGRHRSETKGLIGYFNNVAILRTDLSEKPSFRELLRRVSRVSSETFAHQDIPLQKVAELPNLVRTPLTRAMFVLQNIPNQSLELDGLTVSSLYVDREIANFDLSLSLQEKGGKITGGMQYKTDLFKVNNITQMLEHFQTLLESLVANPEQSISDLPLLTQIKRRQLLNSYEGSASLPQEQQRTFIAPRDELERQLTAIWEKVLGIHPIGVRDNFFELGGHSLLAVQLFGQIEKTYRRNLPVATLFQAPTVEQLANLLRESGWSAPWSSLVAVQPGGSKPPFFCVAAAGCTALGLATLARHLGPDQPFYGLEERMDGQQAPKLSIEDLAAHYIEEISTVQPDGPYFLGGHSFGGLVAFEMAQQLHAQGKEVALLAMLDTYYKGPMDSPPLPVSPPVPFRNRISQHVEQISQLGLSEKLTYLHGYFQERIGRVVKNKKRKFTEFRDRVKKKVQKTACNFYLGIGHPLPYSLRGFYLLEEKTKARKAYRMKLYPGRVTLFWAMGNSYPLQTYHNRLGWGKVAGGGLEIDGVPGNHGTLKTEPNVEVLAEKLQACLDKARREKVKVVCPTNKQF